MKSLPCSRTFDSTSRHVLVTAESSLRPAIALTIKTDVSVGSLREERRTWGNNWRLLALAEISPVPFSACRVLAMTEAKYILRRLY